MSSAVWPSPQLNNLERIGSLVGEATSRDEIQRLLSLADASLSGARTRLVSKRGVRTFQTFRHCECPSPSDEAKGIELE